MCLSAVIYLLPGLLLARAAGAPRARSVLVAPVVSAGAVAGAAVLLGVLGIRFSLLAVGIAVLLLGALVLATRLLLNRFAGRSAPGASGAPGATDHEDVRTLWAAVLGGVVINAAVMWWTFVSCLAGPGAILQTYDTPFHFSVITYLMRSGNGSSIGAALVDRTVGSTFYPAGWHDVVALVAQTTHAWLPVAVNANVIIILTVVWPLSVMALTTALLPRRPWAVLGAGAVAGLFGAFPVRFATWGILYSNLLSWAILPAAMALFIWMWTPGRRASSLVLFALAFVGVALCQPNGVFTALVLLVPFLLAQVWQFWSARPLRLLGAALCDLVLIAALAWGWHYAYNAPFMNRTVTFDWPAHTGVGGALHELATGSTNQMAPSPVMPAVLALAVLVWLVSWLRSRDRSSWPVVSLVVGLTIYVIGAGVAAENVAPGRIHFLRDFLTGFWYHDQVRLAAIPVLMAVPLVGALLDSLATVVASHHNRLAGAGAAVLALVLALAPALRSGELQARRAQISAETRLDQSQPLTATELAFMRKVTAYVPAGQQVLNNPYDGSAYGYSLTGLNTVYRSYEANWIGAPTAQQTELHQLTSGVASDPQRVCPLLADEAIQYVLMMPKNNTTYDGGAGVRYNVAWWRGLEITGATPGFSPVLSDASGDTLYRVTACG